MAPDSSIVNAELELILSSPLFKRSAVLSNFLRYVVTKTIEEKSNEIKEYSIAVNALGKSPDFNPQIDAMIRIHAGRLRRHLLEYYNEDGKLDPLIISLKKGSYVPGFTALENTAKLSNPIPAPTTHNHNNVALSRVGVLPFKNLSQLPANDFIVDGFCEQLSSDLAQFPEIAVIAYYSTSRFREERQDVRIVGKELNISHLITGSIYRDEKHLRLSMQLVDTITGAQLWTQTYDRDMQTDYLYDIFDDIIKQVVPKLSGYHGIINRSAAFSTQLDPSLNQELIDAIFWYYHFQVIHTEKAFQAARQRIEKALQQNPNYALGWAILAELYIDSLAYFYPTVNDPLPEANKCLQNALQLDHDCQHAHLALTWMHIFVRDKNSAVESLERCICINPRSPFFLGGASFLFGLLGEYDKSMEYFKLAKQLNPYYSWWVNLGPIFTHFYNGNYEEALEFANSIHIPNVLWNDFFKIAALAQLSRTEEAAVLAVKFQVQFPGKAAESCNILNVILYHELVYDRIKAGIHKAGLPV